MNKLLFISLLFVSSHLFGQAYFGLGIGANTHTSFICPDIGYLKDFDIELGGEITVNSSQPFYAFVKTGWDISGIIPMAGISYRKFTGSGNMKINNNYQNRLCPVMSIKKIFPKAYIEVSYMEYPQLTIGMFVYKKKEQ